MSSIAPNIVIAFHVLKNLEGILIRTIMNTLMKPIKVRTLRNA